MKRLFFIFVALLGLCTLAVAQHPSTKKNTKHTIALEGTASYYADKFQGRRMANGTKYDWRKYTAAANKIPLGTWVRVRNLSNKKTVIVQITDRMSRKNKRLIDVSKASAMKLGFVKKGLTKVRVEIIDNPEKKSK